MRVHNAGNGAVVNVAVSLTDVLNRRDTFFFGLVRQHGAEGDITDHTDMRDLGAIFLVDDNAAALIGLDADVFEAEAGCVGAAADGNEDDVGVELKR